MLFMLHRPFLWLSLVILISNSFVLMTHQDPAWQQQQQPFHSTAGGSKDRPQPAFIKSHKLRAPRIQQSEKPNIVFIITDDQDSELGSLNFMPKAMKYLRDAGATFPNAFVTTPMCCPSRSSMLTGMYVHNHNTYTNNDNCSSPQWQQTYEKKNFGTYLQDAGYRTGYFGKYLNDYVGTYNPPGWTEWMGLIRNTRFYNYTVKHNNTKIKHEDDYHKDYLTDLIANRSVEFFRESKQWFPQRPVAMVLSMPAPHGPEDAAPQYQDKFFGVRSHRTPSWNFAPNPDKQWLLQYTSKMSDVQIAFTDLLHVKRLQTLQSVDDAVEKVCKMLEELDELNNTYVIYTSDHGYHLGQYGLVKGKAMPYEFDIKVPFLIRGPKIPGNIRIPNVVLNLDLAPTMLDIAGVTVPDHMDGSSIIKLFEGPEEIKSEEIRKKKMWRDTFLVERGKLTMRKLKVQEKLEAHYNRLVPLPTKDQQLKDICSNPEYQPPCDGDKEWQCRRNENGKLRIFKCRHNDSETSTDQPLLSQCRCPHNGNPIHLMEKKRQLTFLKKNVNQPKMIQTRFINRRTKRFGKRQLRHGNSQDDDIVDFGDSLKIDLSDRWTPTDLEMDGIAIPCRLSVNESVTCEHYVYTDVQKWEVQKNKVEKIIRAYKDRISQLKDIRKHIIDSKPTVPLSEDLGYRGTVEMSTEDNSFSNLRINNSLVATTSNYNVLSAVELTVEDNEKSEERLEIEENREERDLEPSRTFDITDAKENKDECICSDDDGDIDYDGSRRIKNWKAENFGRHSEKQDKVYHRKPRTDRLNSNKLEQVRYLKKKNKRNRTNSKQTGASTKYNCGMADVGCSEDASTTLPFESGASRKVNWDSVDFSQYRSRNDPNCHVEGLECSRMDNEHWKVAPFWTEGPFCFCPNSNNNTYWCLRTVNETHNFLYCEFITGFISFYDMIKDPYQLRNAVHDLNYEVLHQLHNTLDKMKGCKGARKCNFWSRMHEDEKNSWKQSRHSTKQEKLRQHNLDQPHSRSLKSSVKRGM